MLNHNFSFTELPPSSLLFLLIFRIIFASSFLFRAAPVSSFHVTKAIMHQITLMWMRRAAKRTSEHTKTQKNTPNQCRERSNEILEKSHHIIYSIYIIKCFQRTLCLFCDHLVSFFFLGSCWTSNIAALAQTISLSRPEGYTFCLNFQNSGIIWMWK